MNLDNFFACIDDTTLSTMNLEIATVTMWGSAGSAIGQVLLFKG
jgi:hypothetical protein